MTCSLSGLLSTKMIDHTTALMLLVLHIESPVLCIAILVIPIPMLINMMLMVVDALCLLTV